MSTDNWLWDGALSLANQAVNKALSLDPVAQHRLKPFMGKRIGLSIERPQLVITVTVEEGAFTFTDGLASQTDANISGPSLELVRHALLNSLTDAIHSQQVSVAGDTSLLLSLADIVRDADVDFEDPLSQLVGASTAQVIGSGVRGLFRWGKRSLHSMRLNTEEYLREESGLLANRYQVDQYLADVDQLRKDYDMLEQRVTLLSRQHTTR